MSRTLFIAVVVSLAAWASSARAQVVQLPSYHVFWTNTTVSVPDQGTGTIASMARSSSGSNEFGPLRMPGSSIGSERSVAGASVSAQIHDFDAMESDLAEQARSARAGRVSASDSKRIDGSRLSVTSDRALPSLTEIRRARAAKEAPGQAEAVALLRRGQQAQAEGKDSVASVYFHMAARRASGQLAKEVQAAQRSLNSNSQASARR